MSLAITTYENYLKLIAGSDSASLQQESHIILERFRQSQWTPVGLAGTVFFVDYTSRKYIYVDANCLLFGGFPDTYFYEEGHEGFLKRTHPADYAAVNKNIFPVNLKYLKDIPPRGYPDIVFSHNFRFLSIADNYIHLLQRYSYVPDKENKGPAAVIGVVYDITHFKSDSTIIHTIESTAVINNELITSTLYKAIFHEQDITPEKRLSKQELNVLACLARGMSTKQIADQLSLSLNTINNHRKSMLKKTGSRNSPELLLYASRQRLI